MTETIQRLIEELERLPEKEQEERASSYLEDLHRRKRASNKPVGEREEGGLYESFAILREANLDLPPDFSVTYERELYGRTADLDD